jgi:hypothetical protein
MNPKERRWHHAAQKPQMFPLETTHAAALAVDAICTSRMDAGL